MESQSSGDLTFVENHFYMSSKRYPILGLLLAFAEGYAVEVGRTILNKLHAVVAMGLLWVAPTSNSVSSNYEDKEPGSRSLALSYASSGVRVSLADAL